MMAPAPGEKKTRLAGYEVYLQRPQQKLSGNSKKKHQEGLAELTSRPLAFGETVMCPLESLCGKMQWRAPQLSTV